MKSGIQQFPLDGIPASAIHGDSSHMELGLADTRPQAYGMDGQLKCSCIACEEIRGGATKQAGKQPALKGRTSAERA
ncbi:MAG: hypothetical protein LBU32_23630 [Clostridiales bacterium]|nr:hypothetical protein [Clostridiales bacterium]